jgi:hypothetical protein
MVRDLADPKHALAILDELEDLEKLRKMKLFEEQELAKRKREGR